MGTLRPFMSKLFSVFLLLSLWTQAAFALVGVYTCSCDPVTNAHLAIMKAAVSSFDLEKLFVMVNASGSKTFKSSVNERIGLIRTGLGPETEARIELLPIDQAEKNAAIAGLAGKHAGLITFIGEDSYLALPAEERDSERRQWVVIPRSAEENRALTGPNVRILNLEGLLKISSTELRRQLQGGEVSPGLTSPAVFQEISRKDLYKPLPPEIDVIQKGLFNEAFLDFRTKLGREYPDKPVARIPPPPYDPLSSREAWAGQFVSWTIAALKLQPGTIAAFRESCHAILYGTSPGRERLNDFFYIEKTPLLVSTGAVAAKSERVPLQTFKPERYNIDIRNYAGDRFPDSIKELVIKGAGVYLHDGLADEARRFHANDGFSEFFTLSDKMGGARYIRYLARAPSTSGVRLVFPVAGQDNLARMTDQLGVLLGSEGAENGGGGIFINRVAHESKASGFSMPEEFKTAAFTADDILLIGMQRRTRDLLTGGGEWELVLSSGNGVEVLRHKDSGRRLVNARILYGDASYDLAEVFYRKGIRRIIHLGTAGALDPELAIGDIVIPKEFSTPDCALTAFSNVKVSLPENVPAHTTRHGWVDSVLSETKELIREMAARGIRSVDVEAMYMGKLAQKYPDASVSSVMIVSDHLEGKETYDRLEENMKKVEKTLSLVLIKIISAEVSEKRKPTMVLFNGTDNPLAGSARRRADILQHIARYRKDAKAILSCDSTFRRSLGEVCIGLANI